MHFRENAEVFVSCNIDRYQPILNGKITIVFYYNDKLDFENEKSRLDKFTVKCKLVEKVCEIAITLSKINLTATLKIAQIVVYSCLQGTFIMQNFLTFDENLKYKGDVSLVAYIDFERTAPTDQRWIDPENRKMLAVSYVIIFAFHPDLHIECVIIEHSFGNTLERLADLSYYMCEQLKFKDEKTLLQLKNCLSCPC